MRKYIIGSIFGFILGITASVHAEEIANLIGSPVQGTFPVSVNGEKLSNDAIVVQDTSYLPVRAFGEATGYTVSFSDEREVILTKEEILEVNAEVREESIVTPDMQESSSDTELIKSQIKKTQQAIEKLKINIVGKEMVVEGLKKYGNPDEAAAEEQTLADREAELAQLEEELAELEAQLEGSEE